MRFGLTFPSGSTAKWLDLVVVTIAAALAFALGYVYSAAHPVSREDGARAATQLLMMPAVNYACTGHFGPIRLAPEATSADTAAVREIRLFLLVRERDYSCESFPRHALATSIFDGIDSANVEQPHYLTLLYGMMWRWFGLHWSLVDYVVAGTVALSFFVVYLCLRGFAPSLFSAALALFFVSNPFFLAYTLNPRDALKFPFAVAIGALLIAGGTAVRRPPQFVAYASAMGLLIGTGYGFRSDISFFLLPAVLIIGGLGQVDLSAFKVTGFRRLLAELGMRGLAVGSLIISFGIGGWMPLLNDHYLHSYSGDVGYHPMAMGLLGHSRADLFQRDTLNTGMYMYRNSYNSDLSVGVRIIEYAARRYGEEVTFAEGPYWTNAKRFYLDVVSHIPADLVSGAIGAFVNLMTMPRSLRERQGLAFVHERSAPWASVYGFAANSRFCDVIARSLDGIYSVLTRLPLALLFFTNLLAFFVFLCLTARRFGFRAAVATLILLGAVLAVASLKFEMRHIFYLFAFPLVVWGAAIWLSVRSIPFRRHGRRLAETTDETREQTRPAARAIGMVALLVLTVGAAVVVVLLGARAYQVHVLYPLVADWAQRPRSPAETAMSEVRPGVTRIRILSPIPLSNGGQRRPDDALTGHVEMGVVAAEIDGRLCAGRQVTVVAFGDSNRDNVAYWMFEALSTPGLAIDYVAYFPAFYYRYYRPALNEMHFAGLDSETRDLHCLKGVSLVNAFNKNDVLFEFLIPKDVSYVRRKDLYQQVYLPGIGYL